MKRKAEARAEDDDDEEEEMSSTPHWDFVVAEQWTQGIPIPRPACCRLNTDVNSHLSWTWTVFSCTSDKLILNLSGAKTMVIPLARMAKRPGVDDFLQQMAGVYQIVVFTSGIKKYADTILDNLHPQGKLIAHRLYKELCTLVSGKRTNDLSRLEWDMKRVVTLDDKRKSFCLNPGVKIKAFKNKINRTSRSQEGANLLLK